MERRRRRSAPCRDSEKRVDRRSVCTSAAGTRAVRVVRVLRGPCPRNPRKECDISSATSSGLIRPGDEPTPNRRSSGD